MGALYREMPNRCYDISTDVVTGKIPIGWHGTGIRF